MDIFDVDRKLNEMIHQLYHIKETQEKIMATLTDVSTALATLSTNIQTGFTTLGTDLQTLLTDLGATPQQVQGVLDSVNTISSNFQGDLSTLDSAIKAADPGAPASPAKP